MTVFWGAIGNEAVVADRSREAKEKTDRLQNGLALRGGCPHAFAVKAALLRSLGFVSVLALSSCYTIDPVTGLPMGMPPPGAPAGPGGGFAPSPGLAGYTPWLPSNQLYSELSRRLGADRARGGSLNVSRIDGRVGYGGSEEYRALLEQWPAVGNNESYWKWGLSAAEFRSEDTAVRYRGMNLLNRQSFFGRDGLERIQAVWNSPE